MIESNFSDRFNNVFRSDRIHRNEKKMKKNILKFEIKWKNKKMKNPIVKSDQACKVCVLESIYPTIHLVSCKTKISVCHFFKILRVPCDVMWCICNIRLSWIIFIFWLLFSGYILITFRLVIMSVFNQYSLFFQFFFSCFVWSISFRSIFDKWSPSLMTRMTPMMMMTMTITWIKYRTEKNEKEKKLFFSSILP